mmetsp:Transcript_114160/g.327996  ORF Transcript_114160/g.327996 Transcript_114160/m.327996 type:complete len:127 (-) Transcript_114160:86-466(-)
MYRTRHRLGDFGRARPVGRLQSRLSTWLCFNGIRSSARFSDRGSQANGGSRRLSLRWRRASQPQHSGLAMFFFAGSHMGGLDEGVMPSASVFGGLVAGSLYRQFRVGVELVLETLEGDPCACTAMR